MPAFYEVLGCRLPAVRQAVRPAGALPGYL